MANLKVVSLKELKSMAEGEIVPIPSFISGKMNVRLKKISTLGLFQKGLIPNKLLSAAKALFLDEQPSKAPSVTDSIEVLNIVASEALLEPTIDQLHEAGLELTDAQLMCIFQYTQGGIDALIPSDTESKDSCNNRDK